MLKNIAKHTAMWISVAILLYSYGCILSPQEDPAPPDKDPVEFMDLTEKEHVITNLVLSYQEKDDTQYSKLILQTDDTYNGSTYANGYYWFNQPGAVGTEESILGGQDISRTHNMFQACKIPVKDTHPKIDRLTLTLTEGSWAPVTEIYGEPCEDCWFTEREYDIFLEMGETDIHGYDNVQFYIVPVDEDGLKIYKIAVAKDVLVNID